MAPQPPETYQTESVCHPLANVGYQSARQWQMFFRDVVHVATAVWNTANSEETYLKELTCSQALDSCDLRHGSTAPQNII